MSKKIKGERRWVFKGDLRDALPHEGQDDQFVEVIVPASQLPTRDPRLPEGHEIEYEHFRYGRADVINLRARFEEDLQQRGLKVALDALNARIGYLAKYPSHEKGHDISAKGGATRAVVFFDGDSVASAWSRCSLWENFNRSTGRDVARGRALKALAKGLPPGMHPEEAAR